MPYVGNTALTVVSTVTIVEIAELMTNYRLYNFGREEIFNIRMVATANNFRTLNHFMIEQYFFHYLQNLLTYFFKTRLSLGGRGGSSSSWSLQASRSSATKDRCSAGMPRRDRLRSSTQSRHRVLGRPLGLRPIGVEQSSFLAVLSWDIRVTCPYQRSCDLSSRKSSDSMFRDSRISAL